MQAADHQKKTKNKGGGEGKGGLSAPTQRNYSQHISAGTAPWAPPPRRRAGAACTCCPRGAGHPRRARARRGRISRPWRGRAKRRAWPPPRPRRARRGCFGCWGTGTGSGGRWGGATVRGGGATAAGGLRRPGGRSGRGGSPRSRAQGARRARVRGGRRRPSGCRRTLVGDVIRLLPSPKKNSRISHLTLTPTSPFSFFLFLFVFLLPFFFLSIHGLKTASKATHQ